MRLHEEGEACGRRTRKGCLGPLVAELGTRANHVGKVDLHGRVLREQVEQALLAERDRLHRAYRLKGLRVTVAQAKEPLGLHHEGCFLHLLKREEAAGLMVDSAALSAQNDGQFEALVALPHHGGTVGQGVEVEARFADNVEKVETTEALKQGYEEKAVGKGVVHWARCWQGVG